MTNQPKNQPVSQANDPATVQQGPVTVPIIPTGQTAVTHEDLSEIDETLGYPVTLPAPSVVVNQEQGGVCYCDLFKQITVDVEGGKSKVEVIFHLTSRGETGLAAFEDLYGAVKTIQEKYGFKAYRNPLPKTPQPETPVQMAARLDEKAIQKEQALAGTPTPVTTPKPIQPTVPAPTSAGTPAQATIEKVLVTSVTKMLSKNQQPYLECKGGKYTKFGKTAWSEAIPVESGWEAWPMNQAFQPPDVMRFMIVDDKKVTGFTSA